MVQTQEELSKTWLKLNLTYFYVFNGQKYSLNLNEIF